EKLINTLRQVEIDIETADKDIDEKNNMLQGVTDKLTKLQGIFSLTRDINELTTKQRAREEEMKVHDKTIGDMKRTIDRYDVDIALLTEQISDNRQQINIIKAGELYQAVTDTRARFTDESLEVMRERRETILFEIRGIEREHGEIRAKLEAAIDNISRTKTALQTFKRDYDAVDESFTFPVDGDQQITRHHQAMQRGENDIDRLTAEVNNARTAYDRIDGIIEAKKEQFTGRFPDQVLYTFTVAIEAIPSQLTAQSKLLDERKQYIERTIQRTEKEAKDIIAASRKLENFKE